MSTQQNLIKTLAYLDKMEKGPLYMQHVVCGKIKEAPVATDISEIEFDEDVVALPCAGGVITDLPLSHHTEARFPEEYRLAVSKRAAKSRNFVVVTYKGKGCALTVKEAYDRGLREAPNWIPDLTPMNGNYPWN
jgi:hypothetical protein